MSATSLLVIKADTLGDLVVFTPTIRALRAGLRERGSPWWSARRTSTSVR